MRVVTVASFSPYLQAVKANASGLKPKLEYDTEPFFVYQTNFEEAWPHATQLADWDGRLYRIEAVDGDVELEKLHVGVVN